MQIRELGDRDLDPVLELNQGALEGVGTLDLQRLAWIVGLSDQAIVVDDDGTIAGFCLIVRPGTAYDSPNYRWFSQRYVDFGYLDRVVVAASHRRRGVGSMMYDHVETMAGPLGQMALEVYVDPPNVVSLAFHEGRGYTEVGRLLDQANGKTSTMLLKPLG